MTSSRHTPSMPPIPFPVSDEEAALSEVVERSRRLIQTTLSTFPGSAPPPFDPLLYAEVLGIRVTRKPSQLPWDAMLVPVGEPPLIILNSARRSRGRQRFSLAHEIAHTFFSNAADTHQMRTMQRERYYRSPAIRRLERLVNRGAAELLMPRPAFDAELDRHGFSASALRDLADRFDVSREAAALRMAECRDGPCAVGFFIHGPRPSAQAARGPTRSHPERVAYRAHRVFHTGGLPLLFPRGKSVSESSVIYRCSLQLQEMQAEEEFVLGNRRVSLQVSAFPLHKQGRVDGPPTVCAVLTPAEHTA